MIVAIATLVYSILTQKLVDLNFIADKGRRLCIMIKREEGRENILQQNTKM